MKSCWAAMTLARRQLPGLGEWPPRVRRVFEAGEPAAGAWVLDALQRAFDGRPRPPADQNALTGPSDG